MQSPVGLARGASNDFHWTLGGLFSRNAPSGAGRGYRLTFRSLPKAAARAVLRSFFSVVVFRETKCTAEPLAVRRGHSPAGRTRRALKRVRGAIPTGQGPSRPDGRFEMRRAKRGNLSRSETRRARQRARGAGATHLPSTCKHWQVIVVAPARGGFVFISWRGGAAGLFR